MAKKPYLVECSITFTDYIVVYAESKDEADDCAFDLVVNDEWDPCNPDHSQGRDLEVNIYDATATDLESYPVYYAEKED